MDYQDLDKLDQQGCLCGTVIEDTNTLHQGLGHLLTVHTGKQWQGNTKIITTTIHPLQEESRSQGGDP